MYNSKTKSYEKKSIICIRNTAADNIIVLMNTTGWFRSAKFGLQKFVLMPLQWKTGYGTVPTI